MSRKRFGAEEIVNTLREAEVHLSKGLTVAQMCKKIAVTDQTYHKWRREYGGLKVDQARRPKELERENARLKRVVAEQALDMAIMREAASRRFNSSPASSTLQASHLIRAWQSDRRSQGPLMPPAKKGLP
jgi:transposase-like protein